MVVRRVESLPGATLLDLGHLELEKVVEPAKELLSSKRKPTLAEGMKEERRE